MRGQQFAQTGGGEKPAGRWLSWISVAAWAVAIFALGAAIFIGWQFYGPEQTDSTPSLALVEANQITDKASLSLPALPAVPLERSLKRQLDMHTIIPNRPEQVVRSYDVDVGDSVFGIANVFNIEPETVLWANYDQLNDNPDYLEPGMSLNIPPVDGVYYLWQEGDTLEAIANEFEADLDAYLKLAWQQTGCDRPGG